MTKLCVHRPQLPDGLGRACGRPVEFLPEGNPEGRISGWHHVDRDARDHHAIPKGWA